VADPTTIQITLSAVAVAGGVTAFVGAVGTGIAWVWRQVLAREHDSDERVSASVATAEAALRGRYDVVIDGLKSERDNARAAESRAIKELDSVREEAWKSTLPLLEKTKEALITFAETEQRGAEALAARIRELNTTMDHVKKQLRSNTTELKARRA